MSHGRPLKGTFLGAGVLIAAMSLSTASLAATPQGCFFGVWMINDSLTRATRPARGPRIVSITPWGDNGWVRVTGEGADRGEFQLVSWDEKAYTMFGSDPREVIIRKVDDYTLMTWSIREDQPERSDIANFVAFSQDCMRMTMTRAGPGMRETGNPDEDDIRVFDKFLPMDADTVATNDVHFGAWKLNRQASVLTRPPMEDETVILVPWGSNGWAYIAISGGYQPDDFRRGMAPPARVEKRPQRTMYLASWDGKAAYTYGYDPRQVAVRKIDDRRFEIVFDRIHQPWQAGDTGTIVFSNDGKRMIETRNGFTEDGDLFHNDVRVYDKMELAEWPGRARADDSRQ